MEVIKSHPQIPTHSRGGARLLLRAGVWRLGEPPGAVAAPQARGRVAGAPFQVEVDAAAVELARGPTEARVEVALAPRDERARAHGREALRAQRETGPDLAAVHAPGVLAERQAELRGEPPERPRLVVLDVLVAEEGRPRAAREAREGLEFGRP